MTFRDHIRRKGLFSRMHLILLLLISSLMMICFLNYPLTSNSATRFDYPSNENFFHILRLSESSTIPKLIEYKPQLIGSRVPITSSPMRIVIFVKSAIANFQKRLEIRQSWSSLTCRTVLQFQVFFVLGTNEIEREIQNRVDKESVDYRDILQYDFHDDYYNNTYKVMSIMDYFVTNLSHVPFLLIVDDDYFVNPRILVETVSGDFTEDEFNSFVGGFVWYQNRPIRYRRNKWFVSYETYPYEYYPPYVTGGFMLISNPMVKKCHKLLPYLRYLPFEDVLIGILLFKLKIYPTHMENVMGSDTFEFPVSLLAAHGCPENCLTFWRLQNYQENCS